MKKQLTLTSNDFERFRRPTRREKFLAEMNTVAPWAQLAAVIEPYYPKSPSAGGRPLVGLERMLRHSLPAAVVRPVGSGGGGSVV